MLERKEKKLIDEIILACENVGNVDEIHIEFTRTWTNDLLQMEFFIHGSNGHKHIGSIKEDGVEKLLCIGTVEQIELVGKIIENVSNSLEISKEDFKENILSISYY